MEYCRRDKVIALRKVFRSLLAASALAIFLIPVTFYVIEMWATKGLPHSSHASPLHPVLEPGTSIAGDEPDEEAGGI